MDDRAFQLALDEMLGRVQAAAARLAIEAAQVVESAAKRNAPVVTGTLRRSITTRPGSGLGDVYAQVGPTVVYGRRIELGFHGRDSLGRVYHQSGQPYLAPAVSESTPGILALARRRFAVAIRG